MAATAAPGPLLACLCCELHWHRLRLCQLLLLLLLLLLLWLCTWQLLCCNLSDD
jgi:hypothetical protein